MCRLSTRLPATTHHIRTDAERDGREPDRQAVAFEKCPLLVNASRTRASEDCKRVGFFLKSSSPPCFSAPPSGVYTLKDKPFAFDL